VEEEREKRSMPSVGNYERLEKMMGLCVPEKLHGPTIRTYTR
jgi:hypothetical protein